MEQFRLTAVSSRNNIADSEEKVMESTAIYGKRIQQDFL